MIVNENFISNQRKIAKKLLYLRGGIYKTMCISAAIDTKVPIFVAKYCFDIECFDIAPLYNDPT